MKRQVSLCVKTPRRQDSNEGSVLGWWRVGACLFLMQEPELEQILKERVSHGAHCVQIAIGGLAKPPVEPDWKQALQHNSLT